MTDRPSDLPSPDDRRSDDEIDQVLAASVPPAGQDFWDRVDTSLTAIAEERPPLDRPETAASSDTAGEVIRLTDMNQANQTLRSPLVLRLAAASAAVVLTGGAIFLATRGGDDGGDEVATGDSSAQTTSELATTTIPAPGESTSTSVDELDSTTTTTAAPPTSECVAGCDVGLPISPITNEDALDMFQEDVGCYFRADEADLDGDGFDDAVFFSGDFGALMIVDGTTVTFEPVDGAESIGLWTVTDYTGDLYDVGFVDVGEEVETSIESTDRPATLQLRVDDGGTLDIPGTLGCGV